MDKLADQALTPRDIGVRLDPGGALRNQVPRLSSGFNPFVDIGITIFKHAVEMGLALQEDELGVDLHQRQLRRHRAAHLALRLRQGPKPRDVDVRVTEGKHLRRR